MKLGKNFPLLPAVILDALASEQKNCSFQNVSFGVTCIRTNRRCGTWHGDVMVPENIRNIRPLGRFSLLAKLQRNHDMF
jgi:hypothetical protein